MAKTSFTIHMDYQRALRQADQLDHAANSLRKEHRHLQNCRSSIAANWKGDNATAYLKKMDIVEADLEKMAAGIQRAADAVRKIAKETYRAEMRALALAKARKV